MLGFSRRRFLAASSALAGAMVFPTLGRAVELKEPPSLKEAVERGELPPVHERLPENPLVIEPLERPGAPGGTWNHALVGGGSLSMLVRYQGYEPLVRFTPDWNGVIPN